MAEGVIDFMEYMESGRISYVPDCPRPFHSRQHVFRLENHDVLVCMRCDVEVSLRNHPSMEGVMFYG